MSNTEQPITTINADASEPYALIVRHKAINDRRLSLADLGLYVRCLWLHEVVGEFGDVDWFIREFGMSEAETKMGLQRLVDAGYLEIPATEYMEAKTTRRQAEGVLAALEATGGELSEAEHTVVARFAALTEERAQRASEAHLRTVTTALAKVRKSR